MNANRAKPPIVLVVKDLWLAESKPVEPAGAVSGHDLNIVNWLRFVKSRRFKSGNPEQVEHCSNFEEDSRNTAEFLGCYNFIRDVLQFLIASYATGKFTAWLLRSILAYQTLVTGHGDGGVDGRKVAIGIELKGGRGQTLARLLPYFRAPIW